MTNIIAFVILKEKEEVLFFVKYGIEKTRYIKNRSSNVFRPEQNEIIDFFDTPDALLEFAHTLPDATLEHVVRYENELGRVSGAVGYNFVACDDTGKPLPAAESHVLPSLPPRLVMSPLIASRLFDAGADTRRQAAWQPPATGLRKLMSERGINLAELARCTGISNRTLSHYITGKYSLRSLILEYVLKICECLDITPRELYESGPLLDRMHLVEGENPVDDLLVVVHEKHVTHALRDGKKLRPYVKDNTGKWSVKKLIPVSDIYELARRGRLTWR